jgi:hypothetical protein
MAWFTGPHTNLARSVRMVNLLLKTKLVIAVFKNALLASSTSGFHPTTLRADLLARTCPCLACAEKRNVDSILPGISQYCATQPSGCVQVSNPTIGCYCATVANTQSGLLVHGNDVSI